MFRPPVQLDRDNARLLGGAAGSLILHAIALSPMLMALLGTARMPASTLRSELMPEAVEPPPPSDRVPLGIDKPMPSTLTWIGYEDYREHLAQLAEVEQAAMTDDPTGVPIEPQPLAKSQQSAEVAAAKSELDPALPASPTPSIDLASIVQSLSAPLENDEPDLPADAADDAGSPDAEPIPELVKRMLDAMAAVPHDAQPPVAIEERDATQPQPESSSPQAPTPADQADRDADPTSIIDVPVENWKLGRPLAAEGLELRPQRPTFTILTMLTAAPCNPLCEIVFQRDGRPVSARLLETSCDPRIDEAILSSLYRWRASGQPLRDLQAQQTLAVRIRILLTRARR